MSCRFWQQGLCRAGDECRYTHSGPPGAGGGPPDVGAPSPFGGATGGFDTPVCKFFLSGNCTFGEACRNRHSGQPDDKGAKGFAAPGSKGSKGRGKGFKSCVGGQGFGKGTFENQTWAAGKGPVAGGQGAGGATGLKDLTGPYLGKGSELRKVWSMPEDQGHDDGISTAIAMTDCLCTAGRDKRLLLWRGGQNPGGDGLMFQQDNEVNHDAPLSSLLFHAGSKWLFCGLTSGSIVAYRQEPVAQSLMQGHTAPVTCMVIHESVLLSGSEDCTVRAWRYDEAASSFVAAATIQSAPGPVHTLLVRPGSLWVGAERGISCVELQSLQAVGNIESASRVVALVQHQDYVIAAYGDGVVRIFDSNGAETFKHGPLGEHTTNTAVTLMRNPHDGKDMLLCGQELGYVTVYDIPDFHPRGTFSSGYDGDVTAIVDMGAGGVFVTCGLAGEVIIWRWEGSSTMS